MNTTPIVIFGAGGFAREVLQIVLDVNECSPTWDPQGFLVDSDIEAPQEIHGLPVKTDLNWLGTRPGVQVVIAVGSSVGRHKIAQRLDQRCRPLFATLIHPRAWVGRHVELGAGTVVCAGSLLTTDLKLGSHVHVNLDCTVGHDAVLGDFTTLNPSVNISGNVRVGDGVEIGTGSVVIPHAHIGEWSVVGAGAVVTKPLDANVTAVGAPAKVIKTRPPDWHREG